LDDEPTISWGDVFGYFLPWEGFLLVEHFVGDYYILDIFIILWVFYWVFLWVEGWGCVGWLRGLWRGLGCLVGILERLWVGNILGLNENEGYLIVVLRRM
jgi:hypothetical protein